MCIYIDEEFRKLLELDQEIFENAIAVRYPSDFYPERNTIEEAIKITEIVHEFVLKSFKSAILWLVLACIAVADAYRVYFR